MSRLRSVAAACGLAGLVALGGVALTRAQQPGANGGRADSPAQRLRDRLVTIRTEVELMKLEHDADRDDLLATMRQLRRLRRDGLDKVRREAIEQAARQFLEVKAMADAGENLERLIPGVLRPSPGPPDAEKLLGALAKDKEFSKVLKERGIKVEDLDAFQFGRIVLEEETKALGKSLTEAVERKRGGFARLARELHAKKLDLEDAERRYALTR